MNSLRQIYTKYGDDGYTKGLSGARIAKSSPLIEVYGTFDELGAFLGFAASAVNDSLAFHKQICVVQEDIFFVLANLQKDFSDNIKRLEMEIDLMLKDLSAATGFVFESTNEIACRLHLARVVCRRLERLLVRFHDELKFDQSVLAYINRLSDWIYVMGRTKLC